MMTSKLSKLDNLIQELCPNGVEFKELWEITIWDRKFNGTSKEQQKETLKYKYMFASDFNSLGIGTGNVKLLSTGDYVDYTTEELAGEYLCQGEVVTIPGGGGPNIKYHNGKFVTTDNRIATSSNTNILSNKYMYYFMLENKELIDSFYRGSGIRHPEMKRILEMTIPLPPLPIQEEIVRILDKFTELTTELTGRQKQYEYYRNQLLTFDDTVEWKKLAEVVEEGPTSKATVRDIKRMEYGDAMAFSSGIEAWKVSEYLVNGEYIFINGGGMAGIKYNNGKSYYSGTVLSFTGSDELRIRFLYHYLNSIHHYIDTKLFFGGGLRRLNKDKFRDMLIPIPSLEVQDEIIRKLDSFEDSVNNTDKGLLRETELRKEQYEYYRDKLLTFDELN